ncbi:MAG: hypothetical protein QXX95_03695 [Nitrososphaerales archaeon]
MRIKSLKPTNLILVLGPITILLFTLITFSKPFLALLLEKILAIFQNPFYFFTVFGLVVLLEVIFLRKKVNSNNKGGNGDGKEVSLHRETLDKKDTNEKLNNSIKKDELQLSILKELLSETKIIKEEVIKLNSTFSSLKSFTSNVLSNKGVTANIKEERETKPTQKGDKSNLLTYSEQGEASTKLPIALSEKGEKENSLEELVENYKNLKEEVKHLTRILKNSERS